MTSALPSRAAYAEPDQQADCCRVPNPAFAEPCTSLYFYAYASNSMQRTWCFRSFLQRAVVHLAVVRLFVNTCFMSCSISVVSGGISMKLGTNIHHVSGHYWKGLQGQRSKVKVMRGQMHFSGWGIPINIRPFICCASIAGIPVDRCGVKTWLVSTVLHVRLIVLFSGKSAF